MTVARGLPKEIFLAAKTEYDSKQYQNSFIVYEFILLKRKRNRQFEKYKVISEFEPFDTTEYEFTTVHSLK